MVLGYTVQQIAVTFGVTRQSVDSWLAAEELPQTIKDAVEAGEITTSAALQLAGAGHTREEQVKWMTGREKNAFSARIAYNRRPDF